MGSRRPHGAVLRGVRVSPRPSAVLYDRRGSAIAELGDVIFAWDEMLDGARLYHTTGITTALSNRTADEVRASLRAARNAGLTTSYDLNFRGNVSDLEFDPPALAPDTEYFWRVDALNAIGATALRSSIVTSSRPSAEA